MRWFPQAYNRITAEVVRAYTTFVNSVSKQTLYSSEVKNQTVRVLLLLFLIYLLYSIWQLSNAINVNTHSKVLNRDACNDCIDQTPNYKLE